MREIKRIALLFPCLFCCLLVAQGQVTEFPYFESFESGVGQWSASGAAFDWGGWRVPAPDSLPARSGHTAAFSPSQGQYFLSSDYISPSFVALPNDGASFTLFFRALSNTGELSSEFFSVYLYVRGQEIELANEWTVTSNGKWMPCPFSIADYINIGDTFHFLVRHLGSHDAHSAGLLLDDVGLNIFSVICTSPIVSYFPYHEDFEQGTRCWNLALNSVNTSWEKSEGFGNQSIVALASFGMPSGGAPGESDGVVAFSPQMLMPPNQALSWKARSEWGAERLDVLLLHSPSLDGSEQILWSDTVSDTAFRSFSVSLAPFAGQSVYLAFRHFNFDASARMLVIDDIAIDSPRECPPLTDTVSVAACNSYQWWGESLQSSGFYNHRIPASSDDGCDSLLTLNLSITYGPIAVDTIPVSSCSQYLWWGQPLAATDIYRHTLPSAVEGACDTVRSLFFTLSNDAVDVDTIPISSCDTFFWWGDTIFASGAYRHPIPAAVEGACDSVRTLIFTHSSDAIVVDTCEVSSCGDYLWWGDTLRVSDTYFHTLPAAVEGGCDSIITLSFSISSDTLELDTQHVVACGAFIWGNDTLRTPGAYSRVIASTTIGGCDSLATLSLEIQYGLIRLDTQQVNACGAYHWFEDTLSENGIFSHPVSSWTGCDSIFSIALSVAESYTAFDTVVATDSLLWNGTVYTQSGDYFWPGRSVRGCDSVVFLALTINRHQCANAYAPVERQQACGAFSWFGLSYSRSGNYKHIVHQAVEGECDSIYLLQLLVDPVYDTFHIYGETYEAFAWRGQVYRHSGDYEWHGYTAAGCDSIIVLHLSLEIDKCEDFYAPIRAVDVCDSLLWFGDVLTESGYYNYRDIGAIFGRCDSVYEIQLTVYPSYNRTLSVSVDNPYTWHNKVYTSSGEYLWTGTSIHGCDSSVVLALSVGIDDVSFPDLRISTSSHTIFVEGATAAPLSLFDIQGRLLLSAPSGSPCRSFQVPAPGVYLLRIGNGCTRKVSVLR